MVYGRVMFCLWLPLPPHSQAERGDSRVAAQGSSDRGHYRVTHLARADSALVLARNVAGAQALHEDLAHRSADAIGNVYNLTNLEDFSGMYTAVSTGAVLAGGGDVATMRNQQGVVIDLTDTSQGAKIMLAVQGVKITLEGAPTASARP